jgi:hypothetical protein
MTLIDRAGIDGLENNLLDDKGVLYDLICTIALVESFAKNRGG